MYIQNLFCLHLKTIKKPPCKKVKVEATISSKRAQERPLPRPFPLPENFQPAIMAALKEGNLVGRNRTKFVTALTEAIYQYKSRPTTEEYEEVALLAVKKWNFLGRHVCHYH